MLAFLMILMIWTERKPEEEDPKEGEELLILESEEEITVLPGETWQLPGGDAKIRVLLLGEDGSIYHKTQKPDREYPGELEYYEEKDGFVIVNEVPLEEYLRYVVPSEMPSAYADEALKAQAVCARTYAVWQMQQYAYPEYEAHVDDSVSYQVYNNIPSQESTDRAVLETAGQIMLYGDAPVKAYYFSTSCGSTTDENIWEKGDRTRTPYIAGRRTGTSENSKDLTDEETFASFIRKKHAGDLEISEPWYRWNCYVPLTQIEKNVESWMLTRAEDSGSDPGDVRSVKITERNTGGVVHKMLLTGTKGTLEVRYEYNIRLILGIPGGEIHKNDGTVGEGGQLLPSGYFILEPAEEDGTTVGYTVYGGGLGHGAGMSQNGARILAEQGSDYEEILSYFYRGIRLARLE